MKKNKITFNYNGKKCTGNTTTFDKSDVKIFNEIYFNWKESNKLQTSLEFRRSNIPEIISEGLTSMLFNFHRTNGTSCINGASSSCDAISLDKYNNASMIQIKSITLNGHEGPTSFGPKSHWDKLIVMTIDEIADEISYYDLSSIDIWNLKVNKTQTCQDIANQGKRPHINLLNVIKDYHIEPFKKYQMRKEL